jgi:hypothetical protein
MILDAGSCFAAENISKLFTKENLMSTLSVVLIVFLAVIVFGGGGWGYSRWRR